VEQVPKEFLIIADSRELGDGPHIEFLGVVRPEVAQSSPLEPTPQRLDGIEHRGIRRQPLQVQPIGEVTQVFRKSASRGMFQRLLPSWFFPKKWETRGALPLLCVS
jgi:hypothetical protein